MLIVCFRIQEFHESLHSLLLWLEHAERSCQAAGTSQPDTPLSTLQQRRSSLQVGARSFFAAAHCRTDHPSAPSTGPAGAAAGEAGSADLPPAALVPAPAGGGAGGERGDPGEDPCGGQEAEAAAGPGGGPPGRSGAAPGESPGGRIVVSLGSDPVASGLVSPGADTFTSSLAPAAAVPRCSSAAPPAAAAAAAPSPAPPVAEQRRLHRHQQLWPIFPSHVTLHQRPSAHLMTAFCHSGQTLINKASYSSWLLKVHSKMGFFFTFVF